MAEKKVKKTETAKAVESKDKSYSITKSNGRVIYRKNLDDAIIARYKSNGWKVEVS